MVRGFRTKTHTRHKIAAPILCLGEFVERDAVGQPVMRQVACFGSPPPRWLTKDFSACCVITARRASHASPGQKERPRAAAARLAAPRRPAPRLASPCSTRTRTRSHAARVRYARAKQPSTRVSIQEPKGPDSNREPARPPPLAVHAKAVKEQCLIYHDIVRAREILTRPTVPSRKRSRAARARTRRPESTPTPAALASSQVDLRRSSWGRSKREKAARRRRRAPPPIPTPPGRAYRLRA